MQIDSNTDFITAVTENKEGNTEYARYWHGSTAILRPMLIFFNLEQIYIIFTIILLILFAYLLYIVFKKSKFTALLVLISGIMINIFITSFCLEYYWTIIIMLISSIITIKNENKGNERLYYIFFIMGILTCYFDFLTTETLTLTVPLILVLIIRKKEEREESLINSIKLVIKSIVIWLIGYSSMWLLKWIISAIVLNEGIIDSIKTRALIRVNGKVPGVKTSSMYLGAISKNIYTLYPINIVKRKYKFIAPTIITLVVIIIFTDFKKLKEKKFLIPILIVSLIPYGRYIIMANHSYRHFFFTFRAQINL